MVLTADGALQARIAHPKHKLAKTYWVEVEGSPSDAQLERLARGVDIDGVPTRPASARAIPEPPGLWPRDPPIRVRKSIPTAWLELVIAEGRNRQVRRMTAAVGLPTLRLVRWAVGPWTLEGLAPGDLAPRGDRTRHAMIARFPQSGFATDFPTRPAFRRRVLLPASMTFPTR